MQLFGQSRFGGGICKAKGRLLLWPPSVMPGQRICQEGVGNKRLPDVCAWHAVKKTLGSTLAKKLLATISFLSLTSSFLVKKVLAGCCLVALAFVLQQCVHNPIPVLVGLLCTSATPGKNRSPQWQWWQKPCGLVVFAPGSIQPIVIGMGASVPLVVHPVGAARGRLASFELQPT